MTRRNTTSLLAGAMLALALAAAPYRVAAQEAIMLETIGAVRMATPDEAQRANAAHSQPTSQAHPKVAQRHAAIVE